MSNLLQQYKRIVQKTWEANERARWQYGELGLGDGSATVEAPQGNGWVWVKMDNGTITQAYNRGAGKVPLRARLRVRVRDDAGRKIVDGEDTSGLMDSDPDRPGEVYSVNGLTGYVSLALDDIADVNATSPVSGSVLQFNDFDNQWSPVAVADLGLTLDDLNGVTVPSPTEGDLLGYHSGDWVNQATIPTPLAATIHGATAKNPPVDADEVGLVDSAASNVLKKLTWANLKATIKTYYDSVATTLTNKTLDSTNISTLTAKNPPVDADSAVIVDSAASNVFKRVTYTNIKAFLKTYFDTLYDLTATAIAALSGKTTPIDADGFVIADSAASNAPKKVTGTNLKAYLKTYFDTLYNLYVHPNHTGDVTSVGDGATTIAANAVTNAKAAQMTANTVKSNITGSTANAADNDIATVLAQYIHGATGKTTPVGADELALIDSAASNVLKKLTVTNLNTYHATFFFVLAGQSGGQIAKGDTASGGNLTLMSTAHATKGKILFGTSAYDEVNDRLGIGTTAPVALLDARGASASSFIRLGYATGNSYRSDWSITTSGAGINAFRDDTSAYIPYTISASLIVFQIGAVEKMRVHTDGSVGIGTSPAAQLDVLQPTLGSPVLQLASTASNDDPTEIIYQNRLATTNNTITTIHTFTVPSSTTYFISGTVIARRTGGSAGTAEDGAAYTFQATYQNVAGTATLIGPGGGVTSLSENQAGWDCVLSPTGATVRVRVTGATNNNITWHMTARVNLVSS